MTRKPSQATLLLELCCPPSVITNICQVMRSSCPKCPLWFEMCECSFDGSDLAAMDEHDIDRLCLPAVVERTSLSSSNVTEHGVTSVTSQIWEVKTKLVAFTAERHWSCDNDLNFLHVYKGCGVPLHTVQELILLEKYVQFCCEFRVIGRLCVGCLYHHE